MSEKIYVIEVEQAKNKSVFGAAKSLKKALKLIEDDIYGRSSDELKLVMFVDNLEREEGSAIVIQGESDKVADKLESNGDTQYVEVKELIYKDDSDNFPILSYFTITETELV